MHTEIELTDCNHFVTILAIFCKFFKTNILVSLLNMVQCQTRVGKSCCLVIYLWNIKKWKSPKGGRGKSKSPQFEI